jgi:hypothetical protein
VVTILHSRTNQKGTEPELVVLPIRPTWAELAAISSGPVFRLVSTGNRAVARRLRAQTLN